MQSELWVAKSIINKTSSLKFFGLGGSCVLVFPPVCFSTRRLWSRLWDTSQIVLMSPHESHTLSLLFLRSHFSIGSPTRIWEEWVLAPVGHVGMMVAMMMHGLGAVVGRQVVVMVRVWWVLGRAGSAPLAQRLVGCIGGVECMMAQHSWLRSLCYRYVQDAGVVLDAGHGSRRALGIFAFLIRDSGYVGNSGLVVVASSADHAGGAGARWLAVVGKPGRRKIKAKLSTNEQRSNYDIICVLPERIGGIVPVRLVCSRSWDQLLGAVHVSNIRAEGRVSSQALSIFSVRCASPRRIRFFLKTVLTVSSAICQTLERGAAGFLKKNKKKKQIQLISLYML